MIVKPIVATAAAAAPTAIGVQRVRGVAQLAQAPGP